MDSLFKIEFLNSSQDFIDDSLKSYSKRYFCVPMSTFIPCLEELYVEDKDSLKEKIKGKLPKIFSAALKN